MPSLRPSTARSRLVAAVTQEILSRDDTAPFAIASEHPGKAAEFFKAIDQAKGEVNIEYKRVDAVRKAPVKIAPWHVPRREG